ncbi:hypothetical protein IYR97_23760 (plasmid) [Pseudomonas fulva]|jgi:hypothetical protein|uniref:Uncharacterized protein n=3 Tax=Pseudomonas TaxID=286 RepID=A0AAJ5S9A2_9PSED|nr:MULTISPECIES: hypothetical protein [Pseudomonas]MCT8164060.1 hypothetical protein [Pseudomonas sp. HD6422]MCT8182952.1 hypothetical protein [Pseudomonas sp. HD6421]MDH1930424.1 hypothetical protein [Pseudomonas sp. GD03696]MDM1711779.1 hypothetical protein [Pseudomonas sp. 165]ORL67182.1 hypothetical protein B7H19_19185 [Pseudomonas putida]
MKIVIHLRPLHVLALSAAILVAGYGWQQHASQAEAQRQADIDAKCGAQAALPPEPLKRSLVCVGWSPKTDQQLPARG